MKFRRTKQVKYVPYGADFEKTMNAYLSEIDSPEIHYTEGAAIIEYTAEVYTAETIAEQMELNGCAGTCQECPYFSESDDKRTKWHDCSLKNKKVLKTSFCCDEYYERRLNEKREKIPDIVKGNKKPRHDNRRHRRKGA